MFFKTPVAEMPLITAPTAAEIAAKSNPSVEGKALLSPDMTPPEYMAELENNKLSVDSVNFLANGLPPLSGICWAVQGCGLVVGKLSAPELNAFQLTQGWLKNPQLDLRASIDASLGKVDFTGPGSWTAQAAMWLGLPGGLVASAVAGAIMIAMGLKLGAAMPPIPKPKLELPMAPLPPGLSIQKPELPQLPELVQPKLMKPLLPFIELGKLIAKGAIKCT